MAHPAGNKKLTLTVTHGLGGLLENNSNTKGVTITEYIRRAIANVAIIEMARDMSEAAGGSRDLYIAPVGHPERPIHLLPEHGLI